MSEVGELVYGPRAGVGTWVTAGVTAAALCIPVIVVLAAPRLAELPGHSAEVPVVATAVGSAGRIDAQLTQLPIVITDFPDASSQRAAAEYTGLRVQQVDGAASMFSDTWVSLIATPSSADAVSNLGRYLVSAPTETVYVPQGIHAVAGPAVHGLTGDPRNADRLSNAAVALFDFGVSWNQAFEQRSIESPFLMYGSTLQDRATSLLDEVNLAFPPNRATLLNEAYLISTIPAICGSPLGNLQRGLVRALTWLRVAPQDTTARVLVASLQSRDPNRMTDSLVPGRGDQPSALRDALATLAPLSGVSSTTPLGHAAAGDAYLSAAWAVAGQAPYLGLHFADLARREYLSAQASVNDPGLWSGVAASLDILGDNHGALAAERSAVTLMPDSPELLIGLALQEERVGDFHAMRTAAQQALTLSLGNTNAPFRDVRFISSSPGQPLPGDRGYLGSSFGKDRSRTSVYNNGIGGCGGGGFFTTDVISAVDDQQINDRPYFLPLPDAAVLTALAASLVLSDPSTAESDVKKWKQVGSTSEAAATDSLWLDRVRSVDSVALQAVHLVADGSVRSGTDAVAAGRFAESHLRHAGYVSGQASLFARAATTCRRMARGAGGPCEGESAYYAGDYKTASAALESFYRASQLPAAGVEAAIATWKSGRPEAAHELLLSVLSGQDPQDTNFLGAREILGEVLLDQGDPRAAIDHFEETLNGIKQLQPFGYNPTFIRVVNEHALNNHGVALLWRAQSVPGAIPDCGPGGSVCQRAHDDFEAAISMDPSNPYYLLNAGWSDRLLNRASAAKSELQASVQSSPDNYPALNDLGVMAAQSSDLAAARQAFESSLRARPDYDIAAWNLGVLNMREGSLNIATAQAYLARAVRENPQLKGSPLFYQTDNRIYRAAFGQPLQPAQAGTSLRSYSEAAVATGGIAAFSALGDTFGLEFKSKLSELLSELKVPQLAALLVRPGVARPRFQFLSGTRRAVRTWLFTAVVLAIGTVWGVWSTPGVGASSQLILAAIATALAILVHECGHLVAACKARIKMAPAPSPAGIVISAFLIPLHISSGPYAGHKVDNEETAPQRSSWVYLAGPLSNLVVAAFAYGLYLIQPLPFLLLLASVQLAAAGFSLMPFEPLDGEALSRRRSHHGAPFALLVFVLSLGAAVSGAALALGRI